MNSGIYTITNKTNGHRYVGSSGDLKERFKRHNHDLGDKTHHNRYLQRAWDKYGPLAFKLQSIFYCDPEMCIIFEQRAMDVLNPEYNICPMAGNSLGVKQSEETIAKQRARKCSKETRAKLSAAGKGRKCKPFSKEHRANLSVAAKARKREPCSKETRAKISAAHKGRKFSKEHKANLSKANKGRKLSEEHKAKISTSLMGNQRTLGYKHTAETRAKVSASLIGNQRGLGYKHTVEAKAKMSATRKVLAQSQVHEIRHLLALGDMSQREIAEYFPVEERAISSIKLGQTYADW